MGEVFGIDLGTTYSAVAKIDELDQAVVVKNANGQDTTPSVVFFEEGGNVIVGAEAKSELIAAPDDGVALIKREMGNEHSLDFFGTTYTPESLSAVILKELVQAANTEGDTDIRNAVITVPAYFGVREKEATKQAGEIAGLKVVGILAEPIAAALSVGVRGERKETLLVYDLGGGTFDTTVMIVEPGNVEVVAVDGNRVLGGADWDTALAQLVVDRFIQQAGISDDPSDDPEFMIELLQAVEEKKILLTKKSETTVRCRFQDYDEKIAVTRADFEAVTKHLIDQTVDIAERTITTAKGIRPGLEIDKLILVGGSSRMPMVDGALRAKGWDPKPTEFDLAVAKGAAIYGEALLSGAVPFPGPDGGNGDGGTAEAVPANTTPRPFLPSGTLSIQNVLSRGLGVKFVKNDSAHTPYIGFLVHANDSLPVVDFTLEAGTVVDGQSVVAVELYEQGGEVESEEPVNNAFLKKSEITGLPSLPKGSPIHLLLNVSNEGLVRLSAREPQSGQYLELEATVSLLDPKEVNEAKELVSGLMTRS
ncbi:Hsp70 family protein [Gordonia sp. (in: high G+C Gram-positive bacteria)]|jgi:molecular chaperone DnaK (HSP70)|uniref:Hsp70 family protein n=1 Tax=Gordonia sp. (in: high G+C Gram-positive bacteria) TaxID=84139 RepID=UPI0025BAFA06|nr:Hsp70 family protein [Gordonia sp. (in: high G+C Gram-positive bacteria)]HMS75891.1 Hsp70 family protein [Gordonia sp. (in: high G+C Gram-positive bacteria)]HQV16961.1 Hsp70 family protein [Gordonia sp. (in: high G+C Gram-positive bacteria)]